MANNEFHDQAKGFANALLAHRTASILDEAVLAGRQFQLRDEDVEVLREAIGMLSSCETGLMATEQAVPEGEMGFLDWMDSLKDYETAFDAIVRARLANKEKDVAKALNNARQSLEKLLKGQITAHLEQVTKVFDSISEISLEAAMDSATTAPQEMCPPEELALGAR